MVTLLVCALTLHGGAIDEPDLTKKVSFKINATRAKPALEELSKIAGFPLLTAQVAQNDVLVINVADVPIGELMKRIANVTSCDWEPAGGGFRLIRSEAKMRFDEQAERVSSIDAARKSIARFLKTSGAQQPLTRAAAEALVQKSIALKDRWKASGDEDVPNEEGWKDYEKLRQGSPVGRLVTRVIAMLDPARIAAIPPNERRVFATNPTRMQLALPGAAQRALEDFAQEQALLDDAADSAGVKRDASAEEFGYMEDLFPWSARKGVPSKLLVIVSRWQHSPGASIDATVLDEKGNYLASASETLAGPERNTELLEEIKPKADDKPLKLGPATEQLMIYMTQVFGMFGMDGEQPATQKKPILPDELKQFFLHPEEHDPLQLLIGDGLMQIGDEANLNIVACVPDSVISGMSFGWGKQISIWQFETYLTASGVLSITRGAGWIEAKPTKAASARRDRLDRADLGHFARTVSANGTVRLDNIAAFALKAPPYGNAEEMSSVYSMLLVSDMGAMRGGGGRWEMLRFYATLSPAQRRSLTAGQSIPISSLTSLQRGILTQMIFFKDDQSQEEAVPAMVETGAAETDVAVPALPESEMAPQMRESTEALPEGLPLDGVVRLSISTSDTLQTGSSMMFDSGGMTADSIGSYLAMREKPDIFGAYDNDFQVDLKNIRLGQSTTYDFTFGLSRKYIVNKRLSETLITDPTRYTVETLPASIKKQIDEALIRYREEFKDMKREDISRTITGGSRPPPPRS